MKQVTHFIGSDAIFHAQFVYPGYEWVPDPSYGFIFRTNSTLVTEVESAAIKFDELVIVSDEKREGSIICLKRFFEKNKIEYKFTHLWVSDIL